jgi:hypothetical protein
MDKAFGYIDRAGRVTINPQFNSATDFSEGLARVLVGGHFDSSVNRVVDAKWGFIDRTGKYVIMPQFDHAGDFHEGLAMVGIGSPGLSDGLGDFSDFKYGYIDRKGRWQINPQFDWHICRDDGVSEQNATPDAVSFSEGMAVVKIRQTFGEKLGYINKAGKLVINPQFDRAGPFRDGLAFVAAGSEEGYIDRRGRHVWKTTIEH